MSENKKFLELAKDASLSSPDPSRKTGCAVVTEAFCIRGCNTFPRGVQNTPERLERPKKYTYLEHAERNAIYFAAKMGISLAGSTIYLTWYPCADCARALVQSGIAKMVCHEPDWTEERYGFRDAETILKEGGVEIEYEIPEAPLESAK